jgi:hypothetical protein
MFSAYKIGVQLSLASNLGTGLALLATQFSALNKHVGGTQNSVNQLEKQLLSIKRLGLIGGALTAVGTFGLAALKGPLDEARKFQTEVARFTALGLGDRANADAVKFANGMNIMGSSARENLKLLKEATAITGDLHHAMEITPLLAKMKFGIESVMGEGSGAGFERMFQDAIKVTELRGALVDRQTGHIDTAKFTRVLDMMTKAYVASGGTVKPSDYLAAIKTGGLSAKLMNDEMFFYGLGHFMQESGGSRTGTAAMSMFQNWAMGRMPQRVAERMSGLGLLDPKAIHYGTTGHITGVDPMGIVRAQEFTQNPFKYVNEVVVPLLQKKGYSGDNLNLQLGTLFGIRTAQNLADQMVREQKVADLYITRAGKASGIEGLYKGGTNTVDGQFINLHAQWANVMKELGITILPVAIRALRIVNEVLSDGVRLMREYPKFTQYMTVAFGVLSAIVATGGVVMMATAAFKALGLALAMQGIGGAAGITKMGLAMGGLKGGLVALSAGIGYLAGTLLNDKVITPLIQKFSGNKNGTLGTEIYNWFHDDENNPGARRSGQWGPAYTGPGSRVVPTGKPTQTIQVQTQINMDGRKLADAVTAHQAREAARPVGGTMGFDPSMAPRPLGASGGF